MSRIVYVNGDWLPEAEAKVSVFDRGFLMADGVYEVTSVLGGKLIDFTGHCIRLARSLGELEMTNPHSEAEWLAIHREIVAENGIEDGFVTEGTSNNAYIVKGNKIITRALSSDILHGITRAAVLRFAKEAQMEVEERNFTIAEAQAADEAFITSASAFVMPVVEIDGKALSDGKVGRVAPRMREIYLDEMRKAAL